jgi:hypothetical protein
MSKTPPALPNTTHGRALRDLLTIADDLVTGRATTSASRAIRRAVIALRSPDVGLADEGDRAALDDMGAFTIVVRDGPCPVCHYPIGDTISVINGIESVLHRDCFRRDCPQR